MNRRWGFAFFSLLFAGSILAFILNQPMLYFAVNGEVLSCQRIEDGFPIKIAFIHSVQKTPVEEWLTVSAAPQGFLLHSTRYQSFGVGLPFLEQEGRFRIEGEYFILDDMERLFPELKLRIGVGTNLTVSFGEEEYPLYLEYPPGTAVELYFAPYGRKFFAGF